MLTKLKWKVQVNHDFYVLPPPWARTETFCLLYWCFCFVFCYQVNTSVTGHYCDYKSIHNNYIIIYYIPCSAGCPTPQGYSEVETLILTIAACRRRQPAVNLGCFLLLLLRFAPLPFTSLLFLPTSLSLSLFSSAQLLWLICLLSAVTGGKFHLCRKTPSFKPVYRNTYQHIFVSHPHPPSLVRSAFCFLSFPTFFLTLLSMFPFHTTSF